MADQGQTRMPANRMAAPVGPGPAPAAVAMTPKEIFGILRQHVLLMISLTVLGFIIGGVAWYLLRMYAPKYTALTTIRVLPPVEKDPTRVESVQVAKDIQYGYRLSMAGLITRQSTLQKLLDRDKIQQTKWFKRFGKIKDKAITRAFKKLRKRFGASAQRDGDSIVVSMTCGNDREAALIVNEMVDLFLSLQGSKKKEEIAGKLVELEKQQARVQRELRLAEETLDDIRKSLQWGFTDLEARQWVPTIEQRLNDLERERNELVLELKQIQAVVTTLERLSIGIINEQVEQQIESDPVMLVLAQQLAFQQSQLAGRLTKFGENHREVRQTQELINRIRQERQVRKAEIAEQTRQANLKNAQDQLVVLQQRYVELGKMLAEATAKKKEYDIARVQYEKQLLIRDERKLMLDSIKGQIEKLRIMREDPETPKVQFAGYAPRPLEMSSPKLLIYFPGGTMLGLMAGIGLAFLIELLNDLVRTPRDVARFLRIPLLGVIPDAAEDTQLNDVDLCHVVRQAPYSVISESYRRFRTNLKLSASTESSKVLLITSGSAGDGRTSVAVNLATSFVAENKKVLLIDANFWRPSLHSVFPQAEASGTDEGPPNGVPEPDEEQFEFGLSTLLTGLSGYDEIIRTSGIDGLDIIDSGPLPSNPAELLGGAQMEKMLRHQRQSYDYVIVDGPPVLLVSDVKTLTRFVDGTVLVFNAASTRRGAALRTIRELRQVNAPIAGCVLFAVKAIKGGYFTEQFRSYQEYQKLQLAHSL